MFYKKNILFVVLPPEITEGCWTQWISTDNADAAGDFEKLRLLIGQGLVCERPTAIQCQTKESHLSPGGKIVARVRTCF